MTEGETGPLLVGTSIEEKIKNFFGNENQEIADEMIVYAKEYAGGEEKKNLDWYDFIEKKNITELKKLNKDRRRIIEILVTHICKSCSFKASGNNELTSDIDYSLHFLEPDNTKKESAKIYIPYIKIPPIQTFFKEIFGATTEDKFNINFYSHSHFFPMSIKNVTIPAPIKENKEEDHYIMFSEVMRNHESIMRIQEFFAVLKIYQNMILQKCKDICSVKFTLPHFNEDFFNIARDYSLPLFSYATELKASNKAPDIEANRKIIMSKYFGNNNNDQMYLQVLKTINSKINYMQTINERISLEREKYHLSNLISFAAPFSSDSYFTYGALMHVVYLRQRAMNINLGKEFFIHSMLENFGDFIHKLKNISPKDPIYAVVESSKYVARIYDAIMLYYGGNHSEYMSKFTTMDFIGSLIRRNFPIQSTELPDELETSKNEYKKLRQTICKGLVKHFGSSIADEISVTIDLQLFFNAVVDDIHKVYIEFCREKGFVELISLTGKDSKPVYDKTTIELISTNDETTFKQPFPSSPGTRTEIASKLFHDPLNTKKESILPPIAI